MMTNDDLRLELIKAYELILGLTATVADLTILLTPLIPALEPEHDHQLLRVAYVQEKAYRSRESIRLKDDSVATVQNAIRRLKANQGTRQ
ncbi:hypothetical protein [Granulicella aggregans]|uniref:hypothetical protein n=1 Tax=Granulicella aggregans TaxID=474949 RepID=UPI0021E032C8|nr:hypothetical protein [Granulicella aggregans]